MNLFIKSIINRLFHQPTKSAITIISISLGVMIISICINVNFKLAELKTSKNGNQNIVIMSGYEKDGMTNFEGGVPYNDTILENIASDIKSINAINKIKYAENAFSYNDELYKADSCIAVQSSFLENFSLDLIDGTNFIDGTDSKEAMISDVTAELLFQDSSAIGQFVEYKSEIWDDDDERQINYIPYKIIGVYKTPATFRKKQLGIPDIIYSFDSFEEEPYLVLNVKSNNIEVLRNSINEYLKAELGSDRSFLIWSGNIVQDWNNFEFIDEIVDLIILFFNVFAAVTLVVSSFSVFSMIMISVAERSRDIGLQRALGCTKPEVIKMFVLESLVIVLIGSIPGILLSLVFFPEVLASTLPAITGGDIDFSQSISTNMELIPILISVGVTMLAGSIFGVFPSLTAVSSMPIEAIKEN
jgi:putative ABC transport system permease protein